MADLLFFLGVIVVALLLYPKSKGATSASQSNNVAQPPDSIAAYGSPNDFLDNFLEAIKRMEGGKPGDRSVVNNNPGNLRSGSRMTGTAGGYATYADQGDGWDDLAALVKKRVAQHPGWNFYDFFNSYSPMPKSDPSMATSDQYAEYVAAQTGANPTDPISTYLGG